jgi:hypothetical protein
MHLLADGHRGPAWAEGEVAEVSSGYTALWHGLQPVRHRTPIGEQNGEVAIHGAGLEPQGPGDHGRLTTRRGALAAGG